MLHPRLRAPSASPSAPRLLPPLFLLTSGLAPADWADPRNPFRAPYRHDPAPNARRPALHHPAQAHVPAAPPPHLNTPTLPSPAAIRPPPHHAPRP